MKHRNLTSRLFALIVALLLAVGTVIPAAVAEGDGEATDPVQAVIAQLEEIDTLEQMQANRKNYNVTSTYNENDAAVVAAHEEARRGYETYVEMMFAARMAAEKGYNDLSSEQKAQIDPALVAKLNDSLSTKFNPGSYTITAADDEYVYQLMPSPPAYLAYELSPHMLGSGMPCTIPLVDSTKYAGNWSPDGKYVCGQSDYEVLYCCDSVAATKAGTYYKRVNLEDAGYYGPNAAKKIRAIVQNSYPYLTISEMKSRLLAGGLSASVVNNLDRGEIIAAVQGAIWAFSNSDELNLSSDVFYYRTYDVSLNKLIIPMHDFSNESWSWWSVTHYNKAMTYDADAAYRINNLVAYLCRLPGVEAAPSQMVISDIEVARASLIPGSDGTYEVGMYIYLNDGNAATGDVKITVTSSSGGTVTGSSNQQVNGQAKYAMTVKARVGDTIDVKVEGTQTLARGVYFYEAEGGREVSQSMVGVGSGETKVKAEESFTFSQDIEMGLRIHKTSTVTGHPISEITFTAYKVPEGGTVSETPTTSEIEQYAVSANCVGSVVTDTAGYAALELEEGTYLIVEEHNTEKVQEPIKPFYIMLPMPSHADGESDATGEEAGAEGDGSIEVEYLNVVSVYPKNTPVEPPEDEPVIPNPPSNVTGGFSILKHDAADPDTVLAGAEFELYRPATADETNSEIVVCDGVQYAVVPMNVTLTTDANGQASCSGLTCGVYFLVETKAPKGYNRLKEAVTVTVVSSEFAQTSVSIPNTKGNLLPETGGAGVTWFLLGGSMLTLGAVVLLVTRRRMGRYE